MSHIYSKIKMLFGINYNHICTIVLNSHPLSGLDLAGFSEFQDLAIFVFVYRTLEPQVGTKFRIIIAVSTWCIGLNGFLITTTHSSFGLFKIPGVTMIIYLSGLATRHAKELKSREFNSSAQRVELTSMTPWSSDVSQWM